VLIGLTEAGEALREAAWSIPEKIETACRLSDEDLAELRDTLDGLAVAPVDLTARRGSQTSQVRT